MPGQNQGPAYEFPEPLHCLCEVFDMRTPWRFLADLVARKPSFEPTTEIAGQEIKALEYRPVEQEIVPPAEVEILPVETEPVTAVDVQRSDNVDAVVVATKETPAITAAIAVELLSSAAHQEEVSALDAIQRDENAGPVVVEAEQNYAATKRADRRQKARNHEVTAADGMPVSTGLSADTPRSAPSVYDEMLSLDDQIQKLRRELAEKLTTQNAQLRNMLERFNRR